MRSQLLAPADWYLLHDITKPLADQATEFSSWFLQQANLGRSSVTTFSPDAISLIRTALDHAHENDKFDSDLLVACFRLERKLRGSSL